MYIYIDDTAGGFLPSDISIQTEGIPYPKLMQHAQVYPMIGVNEGTKHDSMYYIQLLMNSLNKQCFGRFQLVYYLTDSVVSIYDGDERTEDDLKAIIPVSNPNVTRMHYMLFKVAHNDFNKYNEFLNSGDDYMYLCDYAVPSVDASIGVQVMDQRNNGSCTSSVSCIVM